MERNALANRWVSIDKVATYLDVSRDTIYRWIDTQQFPAYKIGRLWKCTLEEVDAWVKAGQKAPANSSR